MKLTIHREAKKVSGNRVEVTHGTTRLLLDLGLPALGKDRNLSGTRHRLAEELDQEGLHPPSEAFFKTDDGALGRPDAILLSYAHKDPTDLVDLSHPEIPVFASRGISKRVLASRKSSRSLESLRGRFRPLDPEKPVSIGEITVTSYGVDDPLHGAMGILLEAQGETLFSIGDLRMHGLRVFDLAKLIFRLRSQPIDTLLIEGTHIGLSAGPSKPRQEVETKIDRLAAEASGLVLACLSPTHVDRLMAFYRAAQNAGRVLAIDPNTALVMHLSDGETTLPRPTIENGIRIFIPGGSTQGNRVREHSKGIELYDANPISIRKILAEPSKYVCTFWESMLRPDFRGKLPNETLCLYAQWTGYLEEENWKPVLAALNKAKGWLAVVHTTGNLREKDILGLVRIVGAKEIVSV